MMLTVMSGNVHGGGLDCFCFVLFLIFVPVRAACIKLHTVFKRDRVLVSPHLLLFLQWYFMSLSSLSAFGVRSLSVQVGRHFVLMFHHSKTSL